MERRCRRPRGPLGLLLAQNNTPTDRRSLVLSQVLLRLEVHSRCYSHSCYSLDVAKRVSRKGDRPERTGQTLYGSSRNSNLADQETRPFRNSAPQSCRPGGGGKGKVGGLGFGGVEPFCLAFLQRVAVIVRWVSMAHSSCFAAFKKPPETRQSPLCSAVCPSDPSRRARQSRSPLSIVRSGYGPRRDGRLQARIVAWVKSCLLKKYANTQSGSSCGKYDQFPT